VQGDEVCIIALQFLRTYGAECTVEVIDRFYEIAGEALDGEVFCGLNLAFCAVLQVAEVGD